jgi:hypothetical protein
MSIAGGRTVCRRGSLVLPVPRLRLLVLPAPWRQQELETDFRHIHLCSTGDGRCGSDAS